MISELDSLFYPGFFFPGGKYRIEGIITTNYVGEEGPRSSA